MDQTKYLIFCTICAILWIVDVKLDYYEMHLHVECSIVRMIVLCEVLLKLHLYDYIYTIIF